jgi:hypothetical protein
VLPVFCYSNVWSHTVAARGGCYSSESTDPLNYSQQDQQQQLLSASISLYSAHRSCRFLVLG